MLYHITILGRWAYMVYAVTSSTIFDNKYYLYTWIKHNTSTESAWHH